jgi:hypothetical protein
MKPHRTPIQDRANWLWASPLGFLAAVSALSAADTNSPPAAAEPLTPEQLFEGGATSYNNWLDISTGGFFNSGNRSSAQRRRQGPAGAFGGIEDFHYQADVDKTTTLALDGRALLERNDYKLSLDLVREKVGFLKVSYGEYTTWSSSDGGFHPPSDTWYRVFDHALTLNRGEFAFEGGLTLENAPQVRFKYTHSSRDGQKGSTIWGIAHPSVGVTQGLSPSFYDINEQRDAFQLDVTHKIEKTDVGVGIRYEKGEVDNALKITQSPGEPAQLRVTDRQGTSYDLFNIHAFTETWINPKILLSSAYSYTDLDNTFSGSRIYGTDFDVGYVPAAQNGAGYYGLNGGSRVDEYVMELSLMYRPIPTLSITPSFRAQQELTEASSSGYETLRASAPVLYNSHSDSSPLDVRERLDLTYSGVTNAVIFARGEWTEGRGSLYENGGFGPVGGIGAAPIRRRTESDRFFQKYSAGVRLYPSSRVNFGIGGYYKLNSYDYAHRIDSTPNNGAGNLYPAFLAMHGFETYDGNLRMTVRPVKNVTLVSRYEYQLSTVQAEPDSIAGLGQVESAKMTSRIFAQDVSWSPWSRLNLQAGFNYVLSDTQTPISDYTAAILKAQNNYWTANLSSTLVLDDQSDLNLGYFHYSADNYTDNSNLGVPYGAGGQEHAVTATLTRRITANLLLSIKYGYFQYNDITFGGHDDYISHLVYSSLRYRF